MKLNKIFAGAAVALVAGLTVTACAGTAQTDSKQGILDDKIIVGNTAATSGAFSAVGLPFNKGLESVFAAYNAAGGFDGKTIELKHYDDGFNSEQGIAYTEKLVEEDEVFALVGHFGTPTVAATVDYIKQQGVPMVYAATGVSELYNEKAEGNDRAVMPVQPIYDSEGRVLLARAVATVEGNLGLGGTKIGVISTTDEAGIGILAGIKRQAEEVPASISANIKYVTTDATTGTNHSTAVNTLKAAGCDVVIIAANQTPFEEILNYMNSGGYDNVKVITSYVSANTVLAQKLIENGTLTATREAYTTAWLDITSLEYVYAPAADNVYGQLLWASYKALVAGTAVETLYDAGVPGFSEEYWKAAETIFSYMVDLNDIAGTLANAFQHSFNSYALAGYICGDIFVQGLDRVKASDKDLSWVSYIDAMESAPIDIAMGGGVDFGNGLRVGVVDLALNKMSVNPYTLAGELQAYSPITSLADVMAGVK